MSGWPAPRAGHARSTPIGAGSLARSGFLPAGSAHRIVQSPTVVLLNCVITNFESLFCLADNESPGRRVGKEFLQ